VIGVIAFGRRRSLIPIPQLNGSVYQHTQTQSDISHERFKHSLILIRFQCHATDASVHTLTGGV